MDDSRQNRIWGLLLVALAVLALIVGSGWGQQPMAIADSVTGQMGTMRSPAVKVVGWVSEVNATQLQIGDRMLSIDPAASHVAAIQLGDYVCATARQGDGGQLLLETLTVLPVPEPRAAAVESSFTAQTGASAQPLPNQPPDDPLGYAFEFRGVIEKMDPRYWIVGDRMVFVTARTVVQGRPELGLLAEVKGRLLFQDTVLADSIRIVVPTALQEVEFEGRIDSFSDQMWIVNGTVVRIGPRTAVDGTPGVGATAQVRGVLQPDASVLAQQIVVQYPGVPSLLAELEGLVQEIGVAEWVIAETRVLLDSSTLVDDSRAPAEVGMWALARGYPQPDGSLLAVRIRLSRPD